VAEADAQDGWHIRRHRFIVIGSCIIAAFVILMAGGFFGSYFLALTALHSHDDLTVSQACAHWGRIYAATAGPALARLHAAVGWTLHRQLGCRA
jgi:hypothetical protein